MRSFFPFPTQSISSFVYGPKKGFVFFVNRDTSGFDFTLNLLLLVFMFKTSGLVEHLKIFWSKTSTISGDVPICPKKRCVVKECPNLKDIFQDLNPSEIRLTEICKIHTQILHVWNICLHWVKNCHIHGEM